MTIKLNQVIESIEVGSAAYTLFLDLTTGETVYLPDPLETGESDEELELLIDNSPKRFCRLPTKYDVHEYRIMEAFIDTLPTSRAKQDLSVAIRGSGAFRRFRGMLRNYNLNRSWYRFRDEAFRDFAIRWCKDNGISYEV